MNWRCVIRHPVGATLLVMTFLGACADQQRLAARHVNQSGYSSAFRQGYADGCDSVQATRRRDERRYRKDADYMIGWDDGYSACKRR